jgi:bifunctional UDP-N-acetylglucosamine pyrophosphorylase/glucosamine-1-phosphate N-acetyltransferase
MSGRSCLAVVLAAGEGTRMRSAAPKVLHPVGGRPMLGHVVAVATQAGADRVAVVVGRGAEAVAGYVSALPGTEVFVQEERLGTAHAVLAARAALTRGADDVVVLYGDAPLVRAETLAAARERLAAGADLVVVGFEAADPTGYGRLIVADRRLAAIREDRDASPAERLVRLANSGIMAFRGTHLPALLEAIGNDNAKGEFYLTDAVAAANALGLAVEVEIADEEEALGVNDRHQLAACEAAFQRRARRAALDAGATLIAPDTVFFSFDTVLAPDVTVEPNVVFGPGVSVGTGAVIHAFCHLEGAEVGPGASVGPFARLRPGAGLGEKARVGNFVEVKNAVLEAGAKANHLSYIGDAHVGAGANVGAGTITCNYDGVAKHHTEIGAGAFIGSNSALVAPVSIGAGAYVGSGSVVTDDVPPDALAIGRGRQIVKEGRAAAIRNRTKAAD